MEARGRHVCALAFGRIPWPASDVGDPLPYLVIDGERHAAGHDPLLAKAQTEVASINHPWRHSHKPPCMPRTHRLMCDPPWPALPAAHAPSPDQTTVARPLLLRQGKQHTTGEAIGAER
jgi:hypothetical protein